MPTKKRFLQQPAAPGWIPEPALAWKIALAYALVSALWIQLSGDALHAMVPDGAMRENLEILKGWFFVTITAAMLGFALQRYFVRIRTVGSQVHEAGKFASAVVNGLSAQIVVVDNEGVIVACNDAWRRFAAENGLMIESAGLGSKYLDVCTAAAGQESEDSGQRTAVRGQESEVSLTSGTCPLADGIREVLAGRRAIFEQEYACHRLQEKRWFIARVTPFHHGSTRQVIIAHENITERKRAEEAMRQRVALQEQLSQVAATVPGAIYSFRLRPDGSVSIPFASPKAEEIFGIAPEVMREDAAPAFARMHPEDVGLLKESIAESARNLSPWRAEFRVRHPDRGEIWIEGRSLPRRETDGSVLWHGFVHDVTERKLAQERLAEALAYNRLLIETSTVGIVTFRASGEVVTVNPAILRMLGGTEEQVRSQNFRHLENFRNSGMAAAAELALAQGKPQSIDARMVSTFGRPVCFSAQFVPFEFEGAAHLLAVFTDTTERQQAENALHESERHYHSLFENMINGFAHCRMIFDGGQPVDFVYLEVNRAFETQTGLKDAVGKKVTELIPGIREADPEIFEIYGRVSRTGVPERFETYVEALNNWFEISVYSPAPEQFVAIFDVITERKRLEEERETTVKLLGLLNAPSDLRELMQAMTALLHERFDCEAVGIRLREGDDFPYYETRGFPAEFVQLESQLCQCDAAGQTVRDCEENPVLECMCGNVLCGRFNPAKPFFTARGSFWANDTTRLLATTTPGDRQARTRNRCNGEGYESVALIALRTGGTTYGLIQLNDERKNRFTPERIALLERLADSIAISLAHRQDQARLRESEARYRLLAENGSDVIWLFDLSANRFTYVSPSVLRLRGFTVEEVLGQTMQDALTPESYRLVAEGLPVRLAAFAAGDESMRTMVSEVSQPRKDGTTVSTEVVTTLITDNQGRVTYIQGVTRDVTERKHIEQSLRESEQRFRDITYASADWVWEIDVQGRYTFASESVKDVLGYTPEEVLGRTPFDLMPPSEAERVGRQFRELARQRATFRDLDNVNLHKDGTLRHIVTNGVPILGPGGEWRGYRGTDKDVTGRKRAELELRQSLAEKTALLKEVHHRVKNNLQIVASLLNLQAGRAHHPEAMDVLQDTRNRVHSMALLHEVLYSSDNLAKVNFAAYVNDLCRQLLRSFGPGAARVALEKQVDRTNLPLEQSLPCGLIINELVSNALKHAFPGHRPGRITVEVRRTALQEILVRVSDDGVGLPAGLDLASTPTLGLRLLTSLVAQLNGRWEIETPGGGGTAVRVVFPAPREKSTEIGL